MTTYPRHSGPIIHSDHDIGSRVASVVAVKLVGVSNALHERILGVAPPGSTRVLLTRPHDHTEIGHVLARGMSWCFDSGSKVQWEITLALGGARYYRTSAGGSSTLADDGTLRYLDTIPNIRLYVTPYIDGVRNAEGGAACVLRARAFIIPSADATCRFYNRTTGTSGATFNVTAAGGWYTASIPCRGGVENEIDLEANGTAGQYVRVFSLVIGEDRSFSQPASLGANALTSAARP